jgi:hypothetical protein
MKRTYRVFVLLIVLLSVTLATADQTPHSLVRVAAPGEIGDTCLCRCGQSEFTARPLSALVEESQTMEPETRTELIIRSGVIEGAEGKTTIALRRPRFTTPSPIIIVDPGAGIQPCPNCDILGWLRCMEGCERFDWCENLCDALHGCCVQ